MTDAETLDEIRQIIADYEALDDYQLTKPRNEREDMVAHRACSYEHIVRIIRYVDKMRHNPGMEPACLPSALGRVSA